MKMDRGHKNPYLQQRVEEWRELRVQKMAARLQLHSNVPRTISSSVLGYGTYEQPLTVQPGHSQLNERQRSFNHGYPRWNSNYNSNYSRYREHNTPSKQYHHQLDHRTDFRSNRGMDHRGHGSFHQNSQKRAHHTSHRTLYNERKLVNKTHRKYSSCNDVNNFSQVENVNVSYVPGNNSKNEDVSCVPEQNTAIVCDNEVSTSNEETIANNEILAPVVHLIDNNVMVSSDVGSGDLNSVLNVSEIPLPETYTNVENSSSESNEILHENNPLELNKNDDGPSSHEEVIRENSEMASNVELVINKSFEPQADLVDDSSVIAVINDSEFSEQVELDKQLIIESQSMAAANEESVSVNFTDSLATEPQMITNKRSTVAFESTDDSESDYEIADNTSGFELSLRYEPDIEVVVTDATYKPNVNPGVMPDDNSQEPIYSELTADVEEVVYYFKEELGEKEEIQNRISESDTGETSPEELQSDQISEVQNPYIVPSLVYNDVSETEAVAEVENIITKELQTVENKLANMSIVADSNHECATPMQKGRRKVLLEATNIIQSSTIMYSVREIRKNDEIIVTPVRRSLRMGSVTPISKKNICVQNIEELSPETIRKMKFVPNPAIDTSPNCQ